MITLNLKTEFELLGINTNTWYHINVQTNDFYHRKKSVINEWGIQSMK